MDPRRKLEVGDILVLKAPTGWMDLTGIDIGDKVIVESLTETHATLNCFSKLIVVRRSHLGHDLKWGRVIKLLAKDI
jgi:hypothetical protein